MFLEHQSKTPQLTHQQHRKDSSSSKRSDQKRAKKVYASHTVATTII